MYISKIQNLFCVTFWTYKSHLWIICVNKHKSAESTASNSIVQGVQVCAAQHNLIYTNEHFLIIKRMNPISEAGGWDARLEQIELNTADQHGAAVAILTTITCIYLHF